MKSTPLPARYFRKNRSKLKALLKPGSVVVVCSGRRVLRTGKQHYPFRQKSVFFYLTGIQQEGGVLLMNPFHPENNMKEILLIPEPTPMQELWSGPDLTRKEAAEISGIGHVRWEREIDMILEKLFRGVNNIYTDLDHEPDQCKDKINPDVDLYNRIIQKFPGIGFESLSAIVSKLRMIKELEEVGEIRKACSITGSAFRKALEILRPGIREYEVEAEIIAEFTRLGSAGHAFEPIIASGENAVILHYTANEKTCRDGELLLMDFGAEVNNYASDCTRTIPVNGKFTARQREVYDAAYRVFIQARQLMKPGIRLDELHSKVGTIWEEEHIRLRLYTKKEVKDHIGPEPLWKEYFMHGTAHSLGLDVHDPFDHTAPFMPGMVLTCEPAIYIRKEGIGIRLENDILITEEGPLDLTEDIPLEAGEIEELMHMK